MRPATPAQPPAPKSEAAPLREQAEKEMAKKRKADHGRAEERSLGTLIGRIVLDRDDRMVIEVDARAPLSWRPPASLVATTASGEQMLVTLLPVGTTAATQLQPGMRFRIVLERPQGSPRPVRLELELDGRLLVVTLIG